MSIVLNFFLSFLQTKWWQVGIHMLSHCPLSHLRDVHRFVILILNKSWLFLIWSIESRCSIHLWSSNNLPFWCRKWTFGLFMLVCEMWWYVTLIFIAVLSCSLCTIIFLNLWYHLNSLDHRNIGASETRFIFWLFLILNLIWGIVFMEFHIKF